MKGKRHRWVHDGFFSAERRCTECGLTERLSVYTYRSPRYGMKRGWKHRWFKRGEHIVEYKGAGPIPLPCET